MNSTIKKYERDGKVAVLISSDYGSGWAGNEWLIEKSSKEELAFDFDIVSIVLKHTKKEELSYHEYINMCDEVSTVIKRKYPQFVDEVYDEPDAVVWIEKGVEFFIHSYDGKEQVVCAENYVMTA